MHSSSHIFGEKLGSWTIYPYYLSEKKECHDEYDDLIWMIKRVLTVMRKSMNISNMSKVLSNWPANDLKTIQLREYLSSRQDILKVDNAISGDIVVSTIYEIVMAFSPNSFTDENGISRRKMWISGNDHQYFVKVHSSGLEYHPYAFRKYWWCNTLAVFPDTFDRHNNEHNELVWIINYVLTVMKSHFEGTNIKHKMSKSKRRRLRRKRQAIKVHL